MTQTNIIINFNLEGLHNWPNAKNIFPDVGFLSDRHRHIFYFKLKKKVQHDDRDVEIIRFKREVIAYLYRNYGVETDLGYKFLEFGHRSCEMLAKEIAEEFKLNYCSVLEDNENGAEYINENY